MPAEQVGAKPIVLAYSGGLDTSFLVPWLAENYGRPIITVTVDTGGIDAAGAQTLAERAKALRRHRASPDRRARGLLRAGAALPHHGQRAPRPALSAVRGRRARHAGADASRAWRASSARTSIAHGCTAAGNDQVRFEVALRTLAPELEVIAPVRDKAFKRQEELEYLQARNLPVPPYGAAYSINRGLWGVTIGGKETLTSEGSIPDTAWVLSKDAFTQSARSRRRTRIAFEKGRPVGLDGKALSPVEVDRTARNARRAVRHRPRHPSRRHHHRHQGPRRVRSAGRRNAAHRASRAREARAHAAPAAHQGTGRAALRRPGARRPAARSGVPRHRGAAALLAGARHRRGARAVPPGQSVRRRRRVAVLAHGRLQGRVRRSRRRMDADRTRWVSRRSLRSRACSIGAPASRQKE